MPAPSSALQLPDLPLDCAHFYALVFHKPVFPVLVTGTGHKCPAIPKREGGSGHRDATRNWDQIEAWWGGKYRNALIGMPTGLASGLIVLDIDNKQGGNGFHTLGDHYALYDLPETPQVFTRSAGLHCHFAYDGKPEIRNSEGIHGLGPGLDIRGEGGWVVLPCPGSGYSWHSQFNFDTVRPMPAPAWLGHKQPKPQKAATGQRRHGNFDPQRSLQDCCTAIASATDSKWRTLRAEAFIAATLVRDGFLDEQYVRRALEPALAAMGRRANNVAHMYAGFEDAFAEGLAAPSVRRDR
jgi:hypothetical protein